MKPRKIRMYPAIHRRIRELDLNYGETAELIGMKGNCFSRKMNGTRPWTEPEMQRVLCELGKPEETLADFFPRRKRI